MAINCFAMPLTGLPTRRARRSSSSVDSGMSEKSICGLGIAPEEGRQALFGNGASPRFRTEADMAGGRIGWVSGLEFCAGDVALPDDRKECADGEFRVIRNRDCDGPRIGSMLHHHMTAAPPDFAEAVFFKDPAGISTGKNSQFTHAPLRSVL